MSVVILDAIDLVQERRIESMLERPPIPMWEGNWLRGGKSACFLWPLDFVYSETGRLIGYTTPRVPAGDILASVMDGTVSRPHMGDAWRARVAYSFVYRTMCLNWQGYRRTGRSLTSDIVGISGRVCVQDTFGLQFKIREDLFPGDTEGDEDLEPPEFAGAKYELEREADQEAWSVYVVVHHLLRGGVHPFSCDWTDDSEKPSRVERIRRGLWPESARHAAVRPHHRLPHRSCLPDELFQLFSRMFDAGHHERTARPTVVELLMCLKALARL